MEKKRDLIDRNRLLRDPCFREDRYPESHLLRMAIGEQPAVDAVEVVRCKDCFADGCCSVQIDLEMGGEGYCSKGKRRTDNA